MSLSHIDLTNPDHFLEGTPHEWLREIRNEDPVHWHEGESGAAFWCVTKWEDLRHVSRNPKLFSSQRRGTNMPNPRMEERMRRRAAEGGASGPMAQIAKAQAESGEGFPIMLMMDPPRHVKFRRLVQRSFTPRYVEGLEPHIRELARTIVDGVALKGECEFVSEVASDLPLQVICEMMGVPSFLLQREVDGEKLSLIEYASFFLLLCVAGNETTRTVTTNGMRLLIEHPDQLQRLGANLARLELNAIFEEIVPRLRNPELAGPVRRLRSNFVNGVKEMPVRFEAGARVGSSSR